MSKVICPECKSETAAIGGLISSHSGPSWKTCRGSFRPVGSKSLTDLIEEVKAECTTRELLIVAESLQEIVAAESLPLPR